MTPCFSLYFLSKPTISTIRFHLIHQSIHPPIHSIFAISINHVRVVKHCPCYHTYKNRMHIKMSRIRPLPLNQWSPIVFEYQDQFCVEDSFSTDWVWALLGDDSSILHFISIIITSAPPRIIRHQIPEGWGPLP